MARKSSPSKPLRARKKEQRSNSHDYGDRNDGEVGYCRPPKSTQFQPGKSGNEKGRPKWRENAALTNVLGYELFRPLKIQENGVTKSLPAIQVAVRRLMMLATKGDPAAVTAMIKLGQFAEQSMEEQKLKVPTMTAKERVERLADLFNRMDLRLQKKVMASTKSIGSSVTQLERIKSAKRVQQKLRTSKQREMTKMDRQRESS